MRFWNPPEPPFYEDEPQCPHGATDAPGDHCEEVCEACGHGCDDHAHHTDNTCTYPGCTCPGWVDTQETTT